MRILEITNDRHYHFGQDENVFLHRKEHIDFPVRDPLMTALSWRAFGSGTSSTMIGRYNLALDYFEDYEPGVTYHVMENYPRLAGKGPMKNLRQGWMDKVENYVASGDSKDLQGLDDLRRLFQWLREPRVEQFFTQFYPEFWYLRKEQ
jgi:hypothetical protein